MSPDATGPQLQFDADAVRARSASDLAFALALAEERVKAAEQARKEAEQARAQLATELAGVTADLVEVTADRDQLAATQERLWREKQVLANENDVLLQRIARLVSQLAEATGRDRQVELSLEISKLQRQLDARNQTLYGTSSERRSRSRGDDRPERRRRKRTGAKRTPQPKLPIEQVHHRLTPEQLAGGCDKCQGDMEEIANQTEDSEELDIQPIRYVLKVHQRHKYRCCDCGWIGTAPGPDKLIEGGRYSPAFAVQVAIDKYADALPLARQVRRMARAGVEATTQALWDQLERMYILLLPTLLVLHERILQAQVCFIDESPWRMMDNDGGGSKRWWLWTLSDGALTFFQIVPTRSSAAARVLIRDFAGILMADDYAVYKALEMERTRKGGVQQVLDENGEAIEIWTPDYKLATCWMHARRYLIKAERYNPEAGTGLDLIDGLYRVEAQAKDEAEKRRQAANGAVSDEQATEWLLDARRRHRAARSQRLVDQFDAWRKDVVRLEGSTLAEALDHIDRIWSRLVMFLADARIPLDNGHAERQIRGPVVGRKNYQGNRSEAGARVAALFFSLIRSAINLGLDPHAYLLAAVTRALKEPGAVLTPWDYAASLAEQPANI